jgi:hypothetical protein
VMLAVAAVMMAVLLVETAATLETAAALEA